MTRREIRARQRVLADANRRYGLTLTPVPESAWPASYLESRVPVLALWRSRDFLVVAYRSSPGVTRLSVNRTILRDDGLWADGITWDELQRLKREAGFGTSDAVEVFPADEDLVNIANMRHLFVFQARLGFVWRAGVVS